MHIFFKANEDDLLKLFKLAFEASYPMGLGYLHHDNSYEFGMDDLKSIKNDRFYIMDYFKGRMVKLVVECTDEPGKYSLKEKLDIEYQSYAKVYKTNLELLTAAGINEISHEQW